MKRIFTLLALFVFIFNSTAQHVDYENDSRWFFGFNVGGTWNTTDVKNKTYAGAGFILGKQFNYNYGRKLSYDIRLRYLGGNWYGQDYDTTMLSNYSPAYLPMEYEYYKNTPGFTVNNFRTRAHELGLELALHLNGLRERSGWDPYIFGGINLAWNQTTSDLVNVDSSLFLQGYYDYTPDLNESAIKSMLDGDYETAMNSGSDLGGWNVDVVPSLGIGIGYQVGPYFSLGVEHKTSFALRNDWDGFESSEKKWGIFDNDIYHYTSGYLRWNIRGRGNVDTDISTNNNNTNNLVDQPCPRPDIQLVNPTTSSVEVDQQMFAFKAQVKNISSRENVVLRLNGQATSSYFYNQTTNTIEANLILVDGSNTIEVVASNGCGQDVESISVNYVTCVVPVISITQPAYSNSTVDNSRQVVRATISNGATGVTMSVNGVNTNNFFFNKSNGTLESNLTLQEGANTIQIIATNDCGTDTETITINYSNCTDPVVVFGTATGQTVNVASFNYSADVQNVVSKNDVVVRLNGVNQVFTFNASTRRLTGVVNLRQGSNTIEIMASNACGVQTQSITVNYEVPCVQPVISMVTPVGTTQTQNATQFVKATITEITSASQVELRVNGVVINGGLYSASTKIFSHTVSLQEGANTIEIKATNNCGAVAQTVIVNKSTCQLPTVSIVNPSSSTLNTDAQSLGFQATVTGVTATSQVVLTQNGTNISAGASLSGTTYRKSVTLMPGVNTFVITATNSCGTVSQTVSVTYTPCNAPIVVSVNPVSGTVLTAANVTINATVQNVQAANNIQLVMNGQVVTGGTFNPASGQFIQTITLSEGSNSIQLIATSTCGSDQKTISLTYNAPCDLPVITLINPISGTVTTDQGSINVQASISGVTANGITVTLNGVRQTGGTYNSVRASYSQRIGLSEGANQIVITATNSCGTVSETILINYQPCQSPVVTIVSPINNYSTEETTIQFQATVLNADNLNQIVLKLNGTVVAGGSYNATTKQYMNTVNLQTGSNSLELKVTTTCGTITKTVVVTKKEPVVETPEEMITICHRPPGNPENTQELTIPLSAWPAHQAHGDVLGPCPEVEEEEEEESNEGTVNDIGGGREMITICHRPPGNPENTQELTIPLSAWPAHQAHGDVLGSCPPQNNGNSNGNSGGNSNGNSNSNGNNGGNSNNNGNSGSTETEGGTSGSSEPESGSSSTSEGVSNENTLNNGPTRPGGLREQTEEVEEEEATPPTPVRPTPPSRPTGRP